MEVIIGQVFEGIKPAVLSWCRDRTGIAQKLRRLDMLVTKIRSVIEVSEKAEIKNKNLRRLQQIFKDAATQGDEVLRKLRDQADSSSSSSSGIRSFLKSLISGEDAEKLSSTIEELEQISAELKVFLKTLKLELSELAERRRKLKRGADNEERLDVKRQCQVHLVLQSSEGIEILTEKTYFTGWVENFIAAVIVKKSALLQLAAAGTCADKFFNGSMPVVGANSTSRSDTDPVELQKLVEKKDESLLLGDRKECFEEELVGRLVMKGQFVSAYLADLLSRRQLEEIAEVEVLVARIQGAVVMAKPKGEDGSWFRRWIAKLWEAIEEGNSVKWATKLSYITSCDLDDQLLDEVGVIVTHVRLRLESILNDLENFSDLAEAEKLARELNYNWSE